MAQSKIFNLEGYVSLSDAEAMKISGGRTPFQNGAYALLSYYQIFPNLPKPLPNIPPTQPNPSNPVKPS
jgi:hypothetical protein